MISLNIRTITAGVRLTKEQSLVEIKDELEGLFDWLKKTSDFAEGFIETGKIDFKVNAVQTTRLSCNPLEEWIDFKSGEDVAMARITSFARIVDEIGFQFVGLGPLFDKNNFGLVSKILSKSKALSISAALPVHELAFGTALEAAKAIKNVSLIESDGGGNFRFCVSANIDGYKPTPFFPASFFKNSDHDSELIPFALGLETSDLLVKAATAARNSDSESYLESCECFLTDNYRSILSPLQNLSAALAKKYGGYFLGIDASMNPSLSSEAIGSTFKEILTNLSFERSSGNDVTTNQAYFGHSGSLALSYLITRSIKRGAELANATITGYSGLMLPQLEDLGLAEAAKLGTFTVRDLLLCSSVCGVGIDTVPLPGNVPLRKLALLLLDMQALSSRWTKPLSCRVLLSPGKLAGDIAIFDSPHLCESVVMSID